MLRGAIICPDVALGDRLVSTLLESRKVGLVRRLESYPEAVELGRFLRAAAPEVIFLSIEALPTALEVAKAVEAQAPGTQIVVMSRTCDPPTLLEAMRAGIREFLTAPFESHVVMDCLKRIEDLLLQNPPVFQTTDSLYAFLPAKAGCGTTTIAVNTSLALARMPDAHVLLADLDLNSGLVGFMLSLGQSAHSIMDAAENALDLDEHLWSKLVSSKGNLDILPVGKLSPGLRIEGTQIRHILNYARRHYSAICVDLSGMMERYSLEILHEAKRVFLVTTPELPSLRLAGEKLAYLRSQELDDRVSILLNRSQKRDQISLEDMEKLFGMPVQTFPNDYLGVHRALTAGTQVDPGSSLGACFRQLAESLSAKKPATEKEARPVRPALVPETRPQCAPDTPPTLVADLKAWAILRGFFRAPSPS
jgi:pilus assembly protein CpaE